MQCRVFDIQSIQIGDQTLQAFMMLPLQQVPLQRFVVIPFIPLANLPTHEKQLFSRVRPHVSIKQTEIRKLLPEVSWHLPHK